MKEELICVNSDSVNRYGFRIHITAFETSLKEIYDKGMPFLIGHDFHRPIGWTIPFGVFIESHLARLIARKMIAANNDDMKRIKKAVQNFLGKKYYDRFQEKGKDFLPLISSYTTGKEQRIDTGCLAVIDENIGYKIFKDLFDSADDDGLIPLSTLLLEFNYLSQGVFKHKSSELCLFAHEFFRRSQSRFNNFHFFFLDSFIKLSKNPHCVLKIRLDRHMIGYAPSFHEAGELEYHYGPKYNDDISSIKSGISRHQTKDYQRNFHSISSTEFYWKKDQNERTFELEELRDSPSPNTEEQYHCRYVHSIYKTDQESFIHFDGAMRSYSMEEMLDRLEKNFVEYGRKGHYKKLFRIDGKIELKEWKSLITHYMQGNPLIYEYFGIGEEYESFRPVNKELSQFEKLLPFNITKDEGLKIMVSYHSLSEEKRQGRYIDVYDVMSTDKTKIYCAEHLLIEVKNALLLNEEKLDIRDDITFIKFDDQYWNIPSIMHSGDNVPQLLQKTVETFITLFKSMVAKGLEIIISLTLSFEFNDRLVRFSSYGFMNHQIKWLEDNFPFEFTETGITKWVENQRSYLNQFTVNTDTPLLDNLLQTDGILFIKRVHVDYPYDFEIDEKGLQPVISFPSDQDETLGLCSNGKIRPVICYQVSKAIWSDTKEDYFTAVRSKWLNPINAHVEIHKAEALALYWTKA